MFNHKKIPEGIFEGKLVLDIGCGRTKLEGSVGLDQFKHEGVDIVANLEEPLPIADGEYDMVFANQVLEHVGDLTSLLSEIHRILKPGGQLLAHVPYFRSSWAHIDPTHVRSYTLDSLDYYVEGTWLYNEYRFMDESFSSIEKFLDTEYKSTLGRRVMSSLAIKNSFKFENSFLSFLYPFEQLSFLLTKAK
jgi:SAM-dependent methyltransferase